MSYREGETGERGKGQWLWKLPVVDLIDNVKDAKGCQDDNDGILSHTGRGEKAEYGIDKPNTLRMPSNEKNRIKDANPTKDARVPTVGEGGTLNQDSGDMVKRAILGTLKKCNHGYENGKGCYLCDPDHHYRRNGKSGGGS
jgi:hypothetical protein